MENFIIIAILLVLVGGACAYIWKAKKKDKKCIGCPMAGSCPRKCCSGETHQRSAYGTEGTRQI